MSISWLKGRPASDARCPWAEIGRVFRREGEHARYVAGIGPKIEDFGEVAIDVLRVLVACALQQESKHTRIRSHRREATSSRR
jgi:hypothetical protein